MPDRKVLIVGDDTRSFLATVRSLGRRGVGVHVAPFNFQASALTSRYISETHRLPYHLGDGKEWVAAVRGLLDAERFDLVIPCDERSLLPFDMHRASFENDHRIAIPSAKAIEILYDKHRTRELAASTDVPVAAGRLLSDADDADAIVAEFGLPVAIKPRSSYSVAQLHARSNVVIGRERSKVAAALAHATRGETLLEAVIEGRGVGVSVLNNEGRLLQVFQHNRIHQGSPVGGSSYRVSVPVTPALEAASARLLEAIDYTGVAMIEFIVNDQDGDWILLEVNARPWGSLPLSIAAGVDFPYFWYRLLVEEVEDPRASYRHGLHGRNLVADYYYFAKGLAAPPDPRLGSAGFAMNYAADFFRWIIGRETADTLVRDDPKPGIHELFSLGDKKFRDVAKRAARFSPWVRRRAEAIVTRSLRSNRRPRLIFVCQGNICRSSFAEYLFAAECPDNVAGVDVGSAGMLPVIGRPSPREAVGAARIFGVDMGAHRSRHLDLEMATSSSLFITFDGSNAEHIRLRFPDLEIPVLALGDFLDRAVDINDPIGRDEAHFEACYSVISSAIHRLIRVLEKTAN